MIAFAQIVLFFLADLAGLALLAIRPRRSIEAENLVLRRQLALYKERGVRPRRKPFYLSTVWAQKVRKKI